MSSSGLFILTHGQSPPFLGSLHSHYNGVLCAAIPWEVLAFLELMYVFPLVVFFFFSQSFRLQNSASWAHSSRSMSTSPAKIAQHQDSPMLRSLLIINFCKSHSFFNRHILHDSSNLMYWDLNGERSHWRQAQKWKKKLGTQMALKFGFCY